MWIGIIFTIIFFFPGTRDSLSFSTRFSECNHLVSTLYNKESSESDDEPLLQTLISEFPCHQCGFSLDTYLQLKATVSTWPAPHWLCACGTIISSFSKLCHCKHPSRKNIFADLAMFCFKAMFRNLASSYEEKQANCKPFSLTTALQAIFHQDNLKSVNEWLKKVHPSSDPNSPPSLSNRHLKALSRSTQWICNQIGGDPRCKCPDLPNPFFPH